MNLVVMAAGMGSRFGGLKQLTPVGPSGEFLIDYSVYDAIKAGVNKVIFIIKREHHELFRDTIGKRLENVIKVEYAFQEMDDLPIKLNQELERTKPWGTGQALLSSRKFVDDDFMIINADDFYGRDAFQTLAEFLKEEKIDQTKKHYAMVGYYLKNTLSNNGTVSRGICEVEDGYLKRIIERKKIGYDKNRLVDLDEEITLLDENSLVSCNLFGFTKEVFEDANDFFIDFLNQTEDLNKDEFYLPTIVKKSIESGKADLRVLKTTSTFNGMTYKEDLQGLKQSIEKLIIDGVYPENLWKEVTR